MKRFSPFFLLITGLVLSQAATAQTSPLEVTTDAPAKPLLATAPVVLAGRIEHSGQLPPHTADAPPAASVAGAVAASKSQLLLVLLETIQAQQARLDAQQAETEAALLRANRAEAATVAFEQRLRQLEAAGSRPVFWR